MIRLLISGIVQQSSSVWRTHKRISPLSTDKSKSFGGQTKQKVSLVDFHVRQVARNFFADVTALYTVTRNGVSPFSRVFLYLFFSFGDRMKSWHGRSVLFRIICCLVSPYSTGSSPPDPSPRAQGPHKYESHVCARCTARGVLAAVNMFPWQTSHDEDRRPARPPVSSSAPRKNHHFLVEMKRGDSAWKSGGGIESRH